MIVITNQSKEVINTLLLSGIVYPDINIKNRANHKHETDLLYKWFFKECGNNFINGAFWVWYNRCHAIASVGVEIVLDIPDEEVKLSNYYNWCDLIYYTTEEPDAEVIEKIKPYLFTINKENKNEDIQGLIPYIKKEWLISINS